MTTRYIVDTNVILDDQSYFWKELFKKEKLENENIEVLIPQIVNEEIDGLKKDTLNNSGYYQRKQQQKLYMNLDLFDIIPTIKTGINERFQYQTPDNLILNTVLEMKQKEDDDANYILYTNDIMMIIKQHKTYGIKYYTDIKKFDIDILKQGIQDITIPYNDFSLLVMREKIINKYGIKDKYQIVSCDEDVEQKQQVKVHNNILEYIPDDCVYKWNTQCRYIQPKSNKQKIFLDQLQDDNIKIITSVSPSGTGKTLLQLYGQLQQLSIPDAKKRKYNKIIFIVNPSVINSKKDIGYLPGSEREKILPFLMGINDNMSYLFDDTVPDEYNIQKESKSSIIEIRPINYIRGSSISKQIVIQDEQQNYNIHELRTLVSRIAKNSKLILLGDVNQIDEKIAIDYTGIVKLISQLHPHKHELPYVNIYMKKQFRNEILNIMGDFFTTI